MLTLDEAPPSCGKRSIVLSSRILVREKKCSVCRDKLGLLHHEVLVSKLNKFMAGKHALLICTYTCTLKSVSKILVLPIRIGANVTMEF